MVQLDSLLLFQRPTPALPVSTAAHPVPIATPGGYWAHITL